MNNPNYIQLIILLLFVGFSVVSWVIRKLQEQSQVRRIQTERERRELEMLRTGRALEPETPPVATGADSDRLRDLAARRQAQLQELRRRAQERTRAERGPGGPGRESPVVSIPGSAGPIVVERTRTPRPPVAAPPPRPVPLGRSPAPVRRSGQGAAQPPIASRTARMGPSPADQRRRPAQPPQREPSRRRAEPVTRPAAPPPPAAEAPSPAAVPPPQLVGSHRGSFSTGAVMVAGQKLTPDEWRRAFIVKELLSAPIALRDPGAADHPF